MGHIKGCGPDERLLANIKSEYAESADLVAFLNAFTIEDGKVLIEVGKREVEEPRRRKGERVGTGVYETTFRVVAGGLLGGWGFGHEVKIPEGVAMVKVCGGVVSEETLKGRPGKCGFIIVRRQDIFASRIAW